MIGTTSYGFRYLLLDPRQAPPLAAIVDETRALGLETLQICENARPLDLTLPQWKSLLARARDIGLEIHLGCMTLTPDMLDHYLERAAAIPDDTLRIVLEEDAPPTRDEIAAFLDTAVVKLERAGMRIAIENHFHIPCRMLAEAVSAYPVERVAFCLDSANSLRSFESIGQVWGLLGPRACMYHLKDYHVTGSNVGFAVSGAPLGTGDMDVAGFLDGVFARDPRPAIYLENWVPCSGDRETDIAADREWLRQSFANINPGVAARRVPQSTEGKCL
jgi:sugar phosphate isomerase/epimerase